ncbi:hypothetical protein J8281_02190 [Aquimarina sp. U1-2]|uniref:hypothetical protein n=1 Tax=Aquimarina sp. U1-2 TaxID=2823141 RepID=UPI001AECF737|nr:hypothetical protein [Aquimarina sp. U1-2]MBP2830984.1 hypothetical protein [Aquimarina sp. U1-2]
MQTLESVFRFYINSSIHVAVSICALIEITFIKFGVTTDHTFVFTLFFGSIVAYNFVKYSNTSKLYHKRLTKSMKSIRFFTWFCMVLFVYFTFTLSLKTILYIFPFAALTLLYVVPIFPRNHSLRSLAGIKIFIIAIVWAGMTVLVPMIYANAVLNYDFVVEIIQRFLFIVVIMLPFEIRDLQYDSTHLETIPQQIGVTRTKVFGSCLLVVFLLLTAIKTTISSIEILSTILITTISLLFLWGTEKMQSKYYCSFWVESVPILWYFGIVVLSYLFM